jgi:flagellar motor switch protein FliM
MVDDFLSQAEVESLLTARDSESGTARGPDDGEALRQPARLSNKVSPRDFKRPEWVGEETMRALQTMHERFSRNFGAALSALLRNMVEVKLTSVDQLTYSEFVFSLEKPTCFNLIKAAPLKGPLILDINPSILFPLIDRLLGGGSDIELPMQRPLTEIELRLVSRITDLFLAEMKHAWSTVLELNLEVECVESNPQLVQIIPPNEVVILISFELTLGAMRGMVNLCIPSNSIKDVSDKLGASRWSTTSERSVSPESIQQVSHQLGGADIELIVELADTQIATADLIGLQVGDVITTEHDIHKPLIVSVAGRPKFHAEPGAFKGCKAIQVTERITENQVSVDVENSTLD